MKKVSIIIPTYNRKYIIDRAVDSCLDQSYDNVEVVVCDDQSTDGTYDHLVSKYGCNKNVVLCSTYGYGKGANAARNVALNNATGGYFAFLDSDDFLAPDSISDRLSVFEKSDDKVGLVYGDLFFEKNRHLRKQKYIDLNKFDQKKYLFEELALCPFSAIMISRRAYETAGMLDEGLKAWQDDDLVTRVGLNFDIVHCNRYVATIGYSKHRISGSNNNNYEGLKLLVKKNRHNIVRYCGRVRLLQWYVRILELSLKSKAEDNKDSLSGILNSILAKRLKTVMLRKWFKTLYV